MNVNADELAKQIDEAMREICDRMEREEREWYEARRRGEPLPEFVGLDAWLPRSVHLAEVGNNVYAIDMKAFKPVELPPVERLEDDWEIQYHYGGNFSAMAPGFIGPLESSDPRWDEPKARTVAVDGKPVNVCVCDIKSLTSVGHEPGCPEVK